MSTLTENLQQIYTIKNQIKQAIGTSSDIFEDYPSYISNMVTPTGTINISENGTTNVSTYAYAYVSGIGGGGVTPTGTYNIVANGNYDVASYAYAYVAVPETLPRIYLSKDLDSETGDYGSRVELQRDANGKYTYNFGTLSNDGVIYIKLEVEYDSDVFPMNGGIWLDEVNINDDNQNDETHTQIAQFVTEAGAEYIALDSAITCTLSQGWGVNNVTLTVEKVETDGVNHMNVTVDWYNSII